MRILQKRGKRMRRKQKAEEKENQEEDEDGRRVGGSKTLNKE